MMLSIQPSGQLPSARSSAPAGSDVAPPSWLHAMTSRYAGTIELAPRSPVWVETVCVCVADSRIYVCVWPCAATAVPPGAALSAPVALDVAPVCVAAPAALVAPPAECDPRAGAPLSP